MGRLLPERAAECRDRAKRSHAQGSQIKVIC